MLPEKVEKMINWNTPGLNLVRVDRSSFCVFAYLESSQKGERGFTTEKTENISKIGNYPMDHVVSLTEPMISIKKMQ